MLSGIKTRKNNGQDGITPYYILRAREREMKELRERKKETKERNGRNELQNLMAENQKEGKFVRNTR